MSDYGLSRRGVLRRGAATAGAATLASLAGCSSVTNAVPGVGGGGDYNFMYEPGTAGDRDHYGFSVINAKAVRNNRTEFAESTFMSLGSQLESSFTPANVFFHELNSVLRFGNGTRIANGSFNNSDIRTELEDSEAEYDDSEYQGYTIFYSENQGTAYSVGNRLIQTGPIGENDAEEMAELVIDTANGEESRYRSENEFLDELLNQFSSPTIAFGRTTEAVEEGAPEQGRFENTVASGRADTVNGGTTTRRFVRVFENESDPRTSEFEDWVDAQQNQQFDGVDDISINQNGRTVSVEGTIRTYEI